MRTIEKDTTGNVASLYIVDTDGLPKTGVAYNAAGLAVYRTPIGGTQVQITLSADNWTEKGNGRYEVDVADSVYTAVAQHDFDGTITDGIIIGERHDVVAKRYSEESVQSAAAEAIAAYDPPTWTEMSSAFSSQFDHIKGFFQVICRSDAAIAIDRDLWVAAINENEGSGAGSFNNATDSKQAIRDNQQTAAAAAIAAAGIATEGKQDEIIDAVANLDWTARALLSGTVGTVTSNGDFTLVSDDLSATDNQYKNCWLVFETGNNIGVARFIGAYTGATKRVQFSGGGTGRGAFPSNVVAGDQWRLLPTTDLVAGIVGTKTS